MLGRSCRLGNGQSRKFEENRATVGRWRRRVYFLDVPWKYLLGGRSLLFTLLLTYPLGARAQTNVYRDLQDISELEPLRIEDAVPEDGPSAQLSSATTSDSGERGVIGIAQVVAGFPWLMESGVEFDLNYLERELKPGPLELHVMQQVAMEEVIGVSLALRPSMMFFTDNAKVGGKLVALATRTLGHHARVHAELRYQIHRRAGDRLRAGMATDYVLMTTLLFGCAAYFEQLKDEGVRAYVAEVGFTKLVPRGFTLYAALGLGRYEQVFREHFLLGVTYHG